MDIAQNRLKAFLAWQAARTDQSAEIIPGMRTARTIALDPAGLEAEGWGADLPLDFGDAILIGGYDEDRAIYDSEVFAGADPDEPRRSLHLGLDIWAPAGTPVFVPTHGRVHSFQDNDNLKDYGPTIILEHMPTEDLIFYTLYGHLSRDSLDDLYVGKAFAKGDELARLGDAEVNGGWAPHVHFQLILDLMGKLGDFPGVFIPAERDRWCMVRPDPQAFLGV